MSCEQNSNKVSRLLCMGLTRLASKGVFLAGLAVGSAGLAGVAKVFARRLSEVRPNKGPSQPLVSGSAPPIQTSTPQLPKLLARPRITPATKLAATERCLTCRTPWGSKPGVWYSLGTKVYCPDCAPGAANSVGADLTVPVQTVTDIVIKGAGRLVVSDKGTVSKTPPVLSGAAPEPQLLPLQHKIKSKLAPAPIRICLTRRALGAEQDTDLIAQSGYVVLRAADNQDTGLAVTPAIILPSKAGEPTLEDSSQWHVLHLNSGTVLTGQTFSSPEEAQVLAEILAQLDWTKEEEEIIRTFSLGKINATISMVTQLIKSQRDKERPAVDGSPAPEAARVKPGSTSPSSGSPSLIGRLMADRYGGLGRVIGEDKDSLLIVDTLGERYEIDRAAVREPTEADYNLVRIARRVDPAKRPGETCSNCERSTAKAARGEVWYRMKMKTFCPACAPLYAQEQAFELEENVGAESL